MKTSEITGRSFAFEAFQPDEHRSRAATAIFLLLAVIPVFNTILFGGVDNITWVFVSMLAAVLLLLWLAVCWQSDGLVINTSSLQLPLIGLMLVGTIQVLPIDGTNVSGLLQVPASGALSLDPYTTRFMVVRLAVYALFFGACLTFINNESRLRRAVMFVILFGTFMAFFGIMQRLSNPDGIYGLRGTPQAIPFGPFVNQHHFAAFMEMTCALTVGMLFGGVEGREKKLLLGFAAALMAIVIIWSGSRGALLGFLSSLVLVTAVSLFAAKKQGGKGQATIVIAGTALLFIVFGAVLFLGGADQLLRGIGVNNPSGDITTGRSHFWPIALQIFRHHPILGAGLDSFGVVYPAFDTWNGTLRVEQAHNDYLQTLADAGLAGIICVVAFILLLFRKAFRVIWTTEDLRRSAAIGSLAGCFAIMVHSFFDFPLRTPSNGFFFLMLAAIGTVPVAVESRRRRRKHHHHRS